MVNVFSDNSGFPPPERPRDTGALEYSFTEGIHYVRAWCKPDAKKRRKRLIEILEWIGFALIFAVALIGASIEAWKESVIDTPLYFSLLGGVVVVFGCGWGAWDLWKKHVAETLKYSEIWIDRSCIRIHRLGDSLLYPREKVKSAYVTEDGAWAELERREEDEHCDLLIFYWREHAELLWIAELVDRVLILGETPVETPPPIAGDV